MISVVSVELNISRTAFAGATTGQQLLYALDEQVRRYEVEGLVTKYEGWEFLGAVIDDEQICRGIVAQNLTSMEIKSFPGRRSHHGERRSWNHFR